MHVCMYVFMCITQIFPSSHKFEVVEQITTARTTDNVMNALDSALARKYVLVCVCVFATNNVTNYPNITHTHSHSHSHSHTHSY